MTVAEEAPRLIPDNTIALGPVVRLMLDQLPADDALVGPPPDRALIQSLLLLGQLDSIAVSQDYDGSYIVHNGRRRVKAFRILAAQAVDDDARDRWATIEAREIDQLAMPGGVALAAAEIASNANRSENPFSDLLALTTLFLKYGVEPTNPTMEAIAAVSKLTGMPYAQIKKRLKLLRLPPAIITEAAAGRMKVGLVEQIAKLDRDTQERLAERLAGGEPLTTDLVYAATRAIRNDAQSALALTLPEAATTVRDPGIAQVQSWLVERAGAAIRAAGLSQTGTQAFVAPNGKRYMFTVTVEEEA